MKPDKVLPTGCQNHITYRRAIPILDEDHNEICGAKLFTPEYGAQRCMNALCNWNLNRRPHINWSDV